MDGLARTVEAQQPPEDNACRCTDFCTCLSGRPEGKGGGAVGFSFASCGRTSTATALPATNSSTGPSESRASTLSEYQGVHWNEETSTWYIKVREA